jgi:Bifunctional DNA primase/polymerase, N-terminal
VNKTKAKAGKVEDRNVTTLDAARGYLARGWHPIPFRAEEKGPQGFGATGWPDWRFTADDLPKHFNNGHNIGVLLVGDLVDIDLDCVEARHLAAKFLPPTDSIFGRPSNLTSHWQYRIDGQRPSSRKFEDPKPPDDERAMLVELRATGQAMMPPSIHPSGERLAWERNSDPATITGDALTTAVTKLAAAALLARHWPARGRRNDAALALAGALCRLDWSEDEVDTFIETVATQAGDHEDVDKGQRRKAHDTAAKLKKGENVTGFPELGKLIGTEIAARVREWLDPGESDVQSSPWPEPLGPAAYHGVLGELVKVIAPHSEADPAALLVQMLVAAGNLIGSGPYVPVEKTLHHCNLFAVLVGLTSSGRKGTSLDHAKSVVGFADNDWLVNRVSSGLSTGEGLIWAVRDLSVKKEAIKEKGRVIAYQEVIEDHGVEDKRLLVILTEFASLLTVMSREGATLSTVIRQAFDQGGKLELPSKHSPARATNAHISVIGHITPDELKQKLISVDLANGFGNRHLWICVRRSQLLPMGGTLTDAAIDLPRKRLAAALSWAKTQGAVELIRDPATVTLWSREYERLTSDRGGLFGEVTSRAESITLRLSMIFALLDRSIVIKEEHLRAALEVWRFGQDSARFIWGESSGYPEAAAFLAAIRREPGIARSALFNLIGTPYRTQTKVTEVLRYLQAKGLVRVEQVATGGRPAERWYPA